MAELHIHTLTVRNHRISCDSTVLVQHGMGHDAIALDLDDEWDGLSARLVLGPCGSAYDMLYDGAPVVVPAATLAEAGWLPVSVVGHGSDGTVRVTTERCDHLLRVAESGCVDGSVPPEDAPDLLGQLVKAAERADASADAADKAAASATSAASAAMEAAGKVDAAVESATKAAQSATDAAAAATDAAKSATDAAERADNLAKDIPAYVTAAQRAAVDADGSAKAAGESASAAAGSAEQAFGSASAASGSASSAKTSADRAASSAADAAQSAQQVASKYITGATATTLEPGEQATAQVVDQVLHLGIPQGAKGDKGDTGTGVPDGGTPGQLLSKTDSGTAWVDPPSTGNVLVGEVEGYVAHAEDAYAQKPREVRIKGKTWVNRWPVLSGTHNGITVATDGTGLVTVTGTATADADVTADVSGWATGKSYTTMISATPTGCSAYFEVQKPSGNTSINATTTGATLNIASDATNCVAGVHVTSGTTVNASFRVMLVDGTEAPDCFTPCASITSVEPEKLVTSGKNLVNTSGASVLPGTFGVRLPNVTLQPGTYVVKRPSGLTGSFAIYREGDTSASVSDIAEAGTSFTLTSPIHGLDFRSSDAGQITLDNISQFQLELGSTATSYEPPTITTTPLPEVELRSLPNGTCDELVIKADGTCEVERQTGTWTFDGSENWSHEQNISGTGVPYFSCRFSGTDESVPLVNWVGCSDRFLWENPYSYNGDCLFIFANGAGYMARIRKSGYDDVASFKEWLASNNVHAVYGAVDSTEPQSPVTLPTLPAPTFNQYHDSDVPSDTSTEYVRDINIAFNKLQAQISATTVREATNG